MKPHDLTTPLLAWYSEKRRELPWRGLSDPYAVWVSEIMLQQTRVETVIPYYKRWMSRFPTIASLAEASQQEVLAAWEGLGYYSRARNLQRAAQVVMAEHGGELPLDPHVLRKLPGIGRYTAGAIAAIAFGLDEPALDGNIRRVLARVFNVELPARSPAGERRLWELVSLHLPPGKASEYNQALMDLGATVCTRSAPRCPDCPLAPGCQARLLGIQKERPVGQKKTAIPHHTITAAVIVRDGQVLITQRPQHSLLGGLWEFPGGKTQPGESLAGCLRREICEELGMAINVQEVFGVYNHAYTHFRVTVHAFYCTLPNGDKPQPLQVSDLRWVRPPDLVSFPMGKVDRQIANQLLMESVT